MKPLCIIVSGEPGSGKTTLASAIAHRMRVLHIERDAIVGGIEVTQGREIDRRNEGVATYYRFMRDALQHGVSIITDGTLRKGLSEADIAEYISDHAIIVNVHTFSKNSRQRFHDREMNREGWPKDWVEGYSAQLDAMEQDVKYPLELGFPVITVTTDDEYDPTLETLVEQIKTIFKTEQKMQT